MRNILVVDDEKGIGNLIQVYFEKMGFNVTVATGGLPALEIIQSRKDIDLIILDASMPQITGLDVLNQLEREKRLIPLIILTGRSDFHKEKGFEGLILYKDPDIYYKPVALKDLYEIVKKKLAL